MLYQGLCEIISNREVNPGVQLLWINAPEMAARAQPGQFAMLNCDDSGQRLLRRPISFHQVEGERVAFLFARVGEGTRWLSEKKAGETLDILGPLGRGFSLNPRSNKLLLAAGGLGIAPLVLLARTAADQGRQVRLLWGARNSSLLYGLPEFPAAVQTFAATEDGSAGRKGLVTSLVQENLAWADQVCVCGPLPMYHSMLKHKDGGLLAKDPQVSLEVRMGCGLGFCYACTIKTRQGLKQVCKDGPVFKFADVVWEELSE